MANLAELFHKETRLLSIVEMQRDLLESLLVETDESKRIVTTELIKKLKADEKMVREAPAG